MPNVMAPPAPTDTTAVTRDDALSPRLGIALVKLALDAGNETWVLGQGSSMRPTVAPGERVLIAPVIAPLRLGEIALIQVHGRAVLHRVVELSAQGVRTRGDARAQLDDAVPREAVLGRAVAVERASRLVALSPTWRFGARSLARYFAMRARLIATRGARRARARFAGDRCAGDQ